MIPLAVYPWPPSASLTAPEGVTLVQAVPGGPLTVLALGIRPPWFCDAAVVPTPAGLPTAMDVVLSGREDPRIHTAAQWLAELMPGAREMDDVEIAREEIASGVHFE